MQYDNSAIIKKLKEFVESGYEKDADAVNAVIDALKLGKILISKNKDNFSRFDDLAGDCFNPEVNDDKPAKELKSQERAFKNRIYRNGIWGATAEYWTGRCWEESGGSIWGFVGNDFVGSGYEMQLLTDSLEAYNAQELDVAGFVIDPYRLNAA